MARRTFEEIKQIFSDNGYTLISTEYKYNIKLEYRCNENHLGNILLQNFICGQRCRKCGNKKLAEKKRISFEVIQNTFIQYKCTLISIKDDYVNIRSILKFTCEDNHENECTYPRFKLRQNKCTMCPPSEIIVSSVKKNVKNVNKKKPDNITIIFLKNEFNKYNFVLLSTVYEGYDKPLEFVCPNKHQTTLSYHTWKNSQYGCSICGRAAVGEKNRLSYEFVKSKFEERNFVLLTTEYKNKKQILEFKCDNDHINNISFDSFYHAGNGCSICSQSKKHTITGINDIFSAEGYALLSTEYENNKQYLKYKCPNGHKHETKLNTFLCGHRCPTCNEPKGERLARLYLDKINFNYTTQKTFSNCRFKNLLKFDLYVNDSFIIEFDGQQHFQSIEYFGGIEKYKKQVTKDIKKNLFCAVSNIPLLRISYKEINKVHDIIKLFIDELKNWDKNSLFIRFSNKLLYKKQIDICKSIKKALTNDNK